MTDLREAALAMAAAGGAVQAPPVPGEGGTMSSRGLMTWHTRSKSWLYCS